MIYLLDIERTGDGLHRVTCKAFPELVALGPTRKQARRNAADVLGRVIAARMAQGRPLPKPASERQIDQHAGASTELPQLAMQKCMLYLALRQSGLDRNELARRSAGLARRSTAFSASTTPRAWITSTPLSGCCNGTSASRCRAGAAPKPRGPRFRPTGDLLAYR